MGKEKTAQTAKRVTPGRTAKAGNKRKQVDESPEPTRTVKARLSTDNAMATPLTLEALRAELAASNKQQNDLLNAKMIGLAESIAANSNLIKDERRERREEMRKMNERIEELATGRTRPGLTPRPLSNVPRPNTRDDDEYKKYECARNTLIFYPVDGNSEDQQMASLQQFLAQKMQIPAGDLKRNQIVRVRRIRMGRNPRMNKELLVLFSDSYARDLVLSYAKNLASFKDHLNKPTAGVRIDVPNSLLTVKRALDQYGYTLRTDLGPNFKRNIKYDDAQRTLVMDVKYPDKPKWERISYEEACRGNDIAKNTQQEISSAAARLRLPAPSPTTSTSSEFFDSTAAPMETNNSAQQNDDVWSSQQ